MDHSFDHSVFAKDRQRLLDADVAREFLLEIVERARKQRSAIDRRTTRHVGYRLSQWARKRIEEVFGWVKTVGGGRKLRYFGVARNRFPEEMTTPGYNLVRLAKLTQIAA